MITQVVVERAVVRSSWKLDSERLGELEAGEELVATEIVTHPQVKVISICIGIVARHCPQRLPIVCIHDASSGCGCDNGLLINELHLVECNSADRCRTCPFFVFGSRCLDERSFNKRCGHPTRSEAQAK